ncbi:MAG TPA: class I SAM-dependent methyltransferase [Terracidiphilus sp.]|nr:class I SAM-dependent methyltransferase [Terracidiphilus sp.]
MHDRSESIFTGGEPMNVAHRWLCNSNRWRDVVKQYVIPWTLEGLDLGADVLEVGPGYGAATTELAGRVKHLTCVEIHCGMADRLRRQTDEGKVTVLCEDATHSSLPADSFDAAVCFTMLHHIPSPALQDRLLAEVLRVLRPGGVFAGTDSKESRFFRFLHLFDTLTVVNPETFAARLTAAGFEDAQVDVNPYAFRFRGKKPGIRTQGPGVTPQPA